MPIAKLLTPREAAKILQVSLPTLRAWRKAGKGPRVTELSRRSYRYTEDSIQKYLAQVTRKAPKPEPEETKPEEAWR